VAYTTVAVMRTLDGLSNATVYPDAILQEGIDFATALIDQYCGTSFEYKAFSLTLDGTDSESLRLYGPEGPLMFPRTISSCTIDGVAQTTSDWVMYDHGVVVRDTGTFSYEHPGRNVVIAGTAGYSSAAPAEIAWACRTLARQYVLDLHSRIPDRALQVQSDLGNITIAQAGGPGRPTSLPDVNAVLNRYRHRAPAVG
jgi:hypothetical protein